MTHRSQILSLILMGAALLFSFPLADCGDVCVSVTGVFPNATSSTNPPTCKLGTSTGTLNLEISSASADSPAPMAPNLQHVFVTLRGIEAHPSALAAADSPGWQDLAPELVNEPVQIDLMAPSSAAASACAARPIRKSVVRADVYRLIRLRFLSDQPAADEPLPQQNECAGIGFNCVVANNGQKHPLVFDDDAQTLFIAPQQIAQGFFRVLPDAQTNLRINFDPNSSLAKPAGEAVKLAPVFSASQAASCETFPQSQ